MSQVFTIQRHLMSSFFEMMDRTCKGRMPLPEAAPAGAICGFELPLEVLASGGGSISATAPQTFIVSKGDGSFALTFFPGLTEEQKAIAARIAMEVSLLPLTSCEELKSAVCTLNPTSEDYVDANLLYFPGVAYVRCDLWDTRIDDLDLDPQYFERTQEILDTQFLALCGYHSSHHAALAARVTENLRFRFLTELDPIRAMQFDPTSPSIHLALRY